MAVGSKLWDPYNIKIKIIGFLDNTFKIKERNALLINYYTIFFF